VTAAEERDREVAPTPMTTRTELDALTAQLRALTDAVDRLTDRMDSVVVGSPFAVYEPAEVCAPDDDPFAWPTDDDVARYRAGRVLDESF